MFKVYKRSIAMELKRRGFPIEDASSNFKNPNYTIFMFTDSKELREEFEKIQEELKTK